MQLNLKVPPALPKIYNLVEVKKQAMQDIIIMGYIKGKLTKMDAADLLELDYDGITDLLYELEIPSQRALPDDLNKIAKNNLEEFIADFKTKSE